MFGQGDCSIVNIQGKIIRPDGLEAWLRDRNGVGSVAVVSGTYDIFQPGNLTVLMRAREIATTVLVVLETDEQAATHVSAGRPQHPLDVRIEMVANLRMVDGVSWGAVSKNCFKGVQSPIWVIGKSQRSGDSFNTVAESVMTDIVEVESLQGCFTEDILRSIRENKTPIDVSYFRHGGAITEGRQAIRGRRVTVNGCFDILHIGHLRFLSQARAQGAHLTVLMNNDMSVTRYKGPTRPVFPAVFRQEALKALCCVDDVVAFADDDPLEVMKQIRPDIHVKGGSFDPERVHQERKLIESWGGTLVGTPLVEGYSTSNFIQKAIAG